MSRNVRDLLEQRTFLTNAGTETYLVFQQGFDLPEFCAFVVHEDDEAWDALQRSQLWPTLQTAADNNCGLIQDVLVWRAHPDFLAKLGRSLEELNTVNARAVAKTRDSLARWRETCGHDEERCPVLIAADIGPRGDGYQVNNADVTPEAARDYHQQQIAVLAAAQVDLVCALTMTTAAEAIGIAQAADSCSLPIIVSPTVETDGRLPDGSTLGSFIQQVDDATDAAPLFYMVNCAHPTHLRPTLEAARSDKASWLTRFHGFRANSSRKSHEELDNSTELDRGDVFGLAHEMAEMHSEYGLQVIGGCCGTDHEHLAAMAEAAK